MGGLIMTRQEEISNAVDTIFPIPPSENGRKYEQALMATGFEAGVKWADQNPKSPWISIKDKLPCDEKDMVIEFLVGIELRTKKVVVLLEDGFTDITFMYSFPPHGWHWNIDDVITHWFPIPEPPK